MDLPAQSGRQCRGFDHWGGADHMINSMFGLKNLFQCDVGLNHYYYLKATSLK
jgi:hypothetical protein